MPDTRPGITFDFDGVCNACRYQESKAGIDWKSREFEFKEICDTYRSKDGVYDCVVPWSGGKDSSAIAYKLKFHYGMNPLLACVSPMLPTKVGEQNREELLNLGFDYLLSRPNQKVHRYLARKFFVEKGNPKAAWDAQVNTFPPQVAVTHDIKLIFYAEHGCSEYGGEILSDHSAKYRDAEEVYKIQLGDDPRNWTDDVVTDSDLNPYLYPIDAMVGQGVKAYYFGWFFPWHMKENHLFAKTHWRFHEIDRAEGTWNGWDSIDDWFDPIYYHLQALKFGFGKALRDAARMIQGGYMTRKQGIEYVKQYDHEFHGEGLHPVLAYLDMEHEAFVQTLESHRNFEIWEKEYPSWRLREPLPEE